jgi:hypothetical protein
MAPPTGAKLVITGVGGAKVSIVRFKAAEAALRTPELTSTAVRLTEKYPVPRFGVVKLQFPLPSTEAAPSNVAPL